MSLIGLFSVVTGLLPAVASAAATVEVRRIEGQKVQIQICDSNNMTDGMRVAFQYGAQGIPLVPASKASTDWVPGKTCVRRDLLQSSIDLNQPLVVTYGRNGQRPQVYQIDINKELNRPVQPTRPTPPVARPTQPTQPTPPIQRPSTGGPAVIVDNPWQRPPSNGPAVIVRERPIFAGDDDFRTVFGRDIRVGTKVYTRQKQSGIVKGIFGNGDVVVEVFYSNQTVRYEDIAIEGCRLILGIRLCSGETVVTAAGSTGRVLGFFPDRDIAVEANYSVQIVTRDEVALKACYGDICAGDKVVTRSNQSGEVKGVLRNGDAMVEIFYSLRRIPTSDLAVTTSGNNVVRQSPAPWLTAGKQVWDRNGRAGKVLAVFSNGDVSVEIFYAATVINANDLAIEGCAYNGLCSGARVATRSGQTGKVVAIFPNQQDAVVEIFYSNSIQSINNLAW